jgi:hypothetical protein
MALNVKETMSKMDYLTNKAKKTNLYYLKTNIGGWFFDAFLRVDHISKLNITSHPVQIGAPITDHAFLEPAELTIELKMSDSAVSVVKGQFGNDSTRSIAAYRILKQLQTERIPVRIVTNIKSYDNMLLETLSVPQDYKTRFGLSVTATFRELFVGKVQTVKISKRPQTTGSTPKGNPEPKVVDSSAAYKLKLGKGGGK